MDNQELENIQGWTKEVLIRRGDLAEKIQSATERHGLEIEALIKSSKGVSAERRLDIYASGYVLRLLECLETDYPCLSTFLGKDIFKLFAQAYIVSQPSESYSLYNFTTLFPEYLKKTRPQEIPEERRALYELPEAIATYERAGAECSISKGIEKEHLIQPQMFDLMQFNYHFKTPDCVRLLLLEYPIIEYIKQLQEGNKDPLPEKHRSYIGFARRNFNVRAFYLEDWQYFFLKACQSSVDLNNAIDQAAKELDRDRSSFAAELMIWIPTAIDLGFIRAFE